MGLVQIKAVKEVLLVRVVTGFLFDVDFQPSPEVFQTLDALVDDDFFSQQINGDEVHR